MKRTLWILLAVFGSFLVLGFLFVVAMTWALFSSSPDRMPERFVLTMDLTRGVAGAPSADPFAMAFERSRPQLSDIVGALHRAAEDDRVVALRVDGGSGVGGWAVTEEIRDAVAVFRAAGKPALLFAETFGELVPAQGAYYLATAFDEIVLQPSGELGLAGLSVEAPFLRGLLDRWEIIPRFEAMGEFKDAVELFTETGFSAPSREALEAVLRSLRDGLVHGMTDGRAISADSALALLDAGPFSAREAHAAGLVDRLGYRDEAWSATDLLVEPDRDPGADALPTRSISRYVAAGGASWTRGERIALVHGSGAIQRGSPGFDPFSFGGSMNARSVASAIRSAAEDARVKAILFRVDSPGGSYVASDIIRREIIRAREGGTPVVVSMGNAAASGGYLISADADRIVAHPATLTGSIGVVAGKFVAEEFLRSFGVTYDEVDLGDAHSFFSVARDVSPEDAEWLARQVGRIYDDFVDIVAAGRGMSREAVDEVARGRVWTGRDALDAGLVDALGGFDVAIAEARVVAGLDADADVELVRYPAERSFFDVMMEEFRGGPELHAGASGRFGTLGDAARGALRLLVMLGRHDGAAVQTRMHPIRIPGS